MNIQKNNTKKFKQYRRKIVLTPHQRQLLREQFQYMKTDLIKIQNHLKDLRRFHRPL